MDLTGYIQNSASRLAELESEISHFDFNNGSNERFQSMNREYQKLKHLQEAWEEFNAVQQQIAENKEMLASGADPEMAELISADLEEILALSDEALREKLQGMTTIIIAQRIASVIDADKIVVIDEGRIADIGRHEELLERNQIYSDLYYTQLKGVAE